MGPLSQSKTTKWFLTHCLFQKHAQENNVNMLHERKIVDRLITFKHAKTRRNVLLPTSKTSSSSILVPNTTIPLVSMIGLALRSSLRVVLFLQSRMRVMVCLCTLMATRCHLIREGAVNSHTYWVTSTHTAHATLRAPFVFTPRSVKKGFIYILHLSFLIIGAEVRSAWKLMSTF